MSIKVIMTSRELDQHSKILTTQSRDRKLKFLKINIIADGFKVENRFFCP